jgi:DNA repair exonuclease SbcCD ATPase subunit
MSGLGKIFVVINLVFSLVIVGAAAAYLSKADEWKTQYDELKTEHDVKVNELTQVRSDWDVFRSQSEKDMTEKMNQISDLEMNNAELQDQLKSERVNNQQLRDDVSRINTVLQNFQTNINELNTRNSELEDQNAAMRNERLDAQQKEKEARDNLIRVEGELQRAREQIESLEMRVAELDQEREQITNVLEHAKNQGFDIASIAAIPEINAYVAEVNNEIGFVILSVGGDDQVQKGYPFHVYRGDRYLGEVRVDEVFPDHASAMIMKQVDGAQFRINDKATTML